MGQTRSRSALEVGVYVAAALVGCATAVPLLGIGNWPLELLVSFRPHILIGLIVVALLALVRRYRAIAAAVAVAALINAGDIAAIALGSAQASAPTNVSANSTSITILFANVALANGDHDGLIAEIARRDPDIIVLAEATAAWDDAIAGLAARYPYALAQPREHPFGMVVLSRAPFDDSQTQIIMLPRPPQWETASPVALIVRIETVAGPVTVIGIHPFPPLLGTGYELRNFQLAMLADVVAQLPRPVIAVGDFNATPWSPALRRFMKQAGVSGANITPTWPVALGPAGLAIDHVLMSADLQLLAIERGADIGSDHRPPVAVISPQRSPGTP